MSDKNSIFTEPTISQRHALKLSSDPEKRSKLLLWMNEGISLYGNTTYVLVGIFGLDPDTGVESLTHTVEDVPLNDELQVFFYGQRGTDLYTLGAG